MATRNERKARARKARAGRRQAEQKADNAKNVRETVRLNRLNGVPRNYYPQGSMADLKALGSSGRVCGLSRLAPLPDANGNWWEAIKG